MPPQCDATCRVAIEYLSQASARDSNMDRRYFLRNVVGLAALPIAEFMPASIPRAMASIPRAQLHASARERRVKPAGPDTQGLARPGSIVLSSGLRDLDQLTNGLAPGSLIVVASRPSMGKSQLAFQIADHIARVQRRAVSITCAHDGAAMVAQRLIAVRANVWPYALVKGWRLYPDDARRDKDAQRRIQSALAQARTIPILLDDSRRLTVGQIANRASRFALERSVPLGAIILDGVDVFVSGPGRSPSL